MTAALLTGSVSKSEALDNAVVKFAYADADQTEPNPIAECKQ